MLDIILISAGVLLAIVFLVNVHYDIGRLQDSFKSSHPPVPPEPLIRKELR